jgi:pimeloyl-ACP methyl ester carboxylesterase
MTRRLLVAALLGASLLAAAEFPGAVDEWNGFRRHTFTLDTRKCYVVEPKTAAAGKPWIWRARFWGHRPEVDLALLNKGFHLAYMDIVELFGSPKAIAHWNEFYRFLTEEHGFHRKAVLEGMSRGGLTIYGWAAANPEKVACIYADAPVCDFRTWPRGKAAASWTTLLQVYGFKDDAEALAYRGNPIDTLAPLAKAGIPLFHVHGDADEVVPLASNTAVVERRYRELGGSITVVVKPGVGHTHGLADPTPIIEFALRNALR